MGEMIERVAEALYRQETGDGEGWIGPLLNERGRDYYRQMARIAIATMREPTKEMQTAVENDDLIQCGLDDCNKHNIPDDAWRLMIDAALKENAPV